MGDDTALPPLAGRARPLTSYLRQRFAQVTNPPIDHLRERSVMSLRTLLGAPSTAGRRASRSARLLELESFFLFPSAASRARPAGARARGHLRRARRAPARMPATGRRALRSASKAVTRPRRPTGWDGRSAGAVASAPSTSGSSPPACERLTSIVVISDEPREAHDFACLLGYGADADLPTARARDRGGARRPTTSSAATTRRQREAQLRFRESVEDGVLEDHCRRWASPTSRRTAARSSSTALGLARGGRPLLDRDAVAGRRRRFRRARA